MFGIVHQLLHLHLPSSSSSAISSTPSRQLCLPPLHLHLDFQNQKEKRELEKKTRVIVLDEEEFCGEERGYRDEQMMNRRRSYPDFMSTNHKIRLQIEQISRSSRSPATTHKHFSSPSSSIHPKFCRADQQFGAPQLKFLVFEVHFFFPFALFIYSIYALNSDGILLLSFKYIGIAYDGILLLSKLCARGVTCEEIEDLDFIPEVIPISCDLGHHIQHNHLAIKDTIDLSLIRHVRSQAYKLELPPELEGIHNVFHVCYLRNCLAEEPSMLPMEELHVDEAKCLVEEPVAILDRNIKQLRKKRVKLIKVQWKNKHGGDITWEVEDDMRARYPQLVVTASNSGTEFF
ncbi:hypothetical protein LXL04_009025 [Taraxacum kok-saghyz]